jgi:hypothetical protein
MSYFINIINQIPSEILNLLTHNMNIMNQPFYNIIENNNSSSIHYNSYNNYNENFIGQNNEELALNIDICYSYFNNLIQNEKENNPSLFIVQNSNQYIDTTIIDTTIISHIIKLWNQSKEGILPTLEEILEELYKNKCYCNNNYNSNHIKDLYRFYILNYKKIPDCITIELSIEYKLLHSRFPNEEELNEILNRRIQFELSPEDYYQEDKINIGTKNLDKIKIHKYTEQENISCSICQNDIIKDQQYINLEPCGHKFHYNNSDCLDEASIINWLENNNKCPNCKCNINI